MHTTPTPRADLPALMAQVQAFVAAHYPGQQAECVTIRLRGAARPLCLPIPAGPVVVAPPPAVADDFYDDLSEKELAVVQVLEDLPDGEKLTGEEVAEKAGYPYDTGFRTMLAGLVRRKKIRNDRPGYRRV